MSKAEDTPKHTVKAGIAYVTIGGETVNTYVVLGNKRLYVRANEGEEITAKYAQTLSKPQKPAEPVTPPTEQ